MGQIETRVLCLVFAGVLSILVARAQENSSEWTESSWASIEPSKELSWVKCYDGSFECGRFQVPLDYSDPERDSAAIALIRMKANVSSNSPEYRGPILFNPGGPGVGGVDLMLQRGNRFVQIIGSQFDLVGFDPRGVSRSTPRVELFQTREERALWFRPAIKELNHSSDNVASFWVRNKINGQLAQERLINLLPYITTSHVAQDMLHIVEAHGRERLQYWGFSYILKDKVERLIIDGIVDAESDYYTTQWKLSTLDTDKALRWFFEDCYHAGPDVCAFHASSVEAMEDRLNRLYGSIIEAPVPVRTNTSYGLVDYEFLRQTIFLALAEPFALNEPFLRWPALGTGLADLEAGNGTILWEMMEEPPFKCSCDPSEYVFETNFEEAEFAFVCNNGDVVPPSLEDAKKHYDESLEISGWNSLYASMRIQCRSSYPSSESLNITPPVHTLSQRAFLDLSYSLKTHLG
ncbi:hypothetical protein VNI00_009785 [Paramarasmius palmivorus]|uniref:AB hydrolase-1 domain-containing protein n=1 Tax=Paramarasmius palmivorus TaxID=297713 RepID=A0AAW0CQ88_9AGAR